MYVIIVGAGEVGSFVARVLVEEGHEVVAIEPNEDVARRLDKTLDAMVIVGDGVSAAALRRAGIDRADLFLAVTPVDEINLVACMTARKHGPPGLRAVAKVKQSQDMAGGEALSADDLGLDALISSEQAIATIAVEMLRYAGSGEIRELAAGRLVLVGMVLGAESPLIMETLADIRPDLPEQSLVIAVQGKDGVRIPTGADRLQVDERAYVLTLPKHLTELTILSGQPWYSVHRVLIIGLGNTGFALARELETKSGYTTTILERDQNRAEAIAPRLPKSMVMHADGSDPELLRRVLEEQHSDAVVVLLKDPERSLLLGIFAKSLGARKVIVRCDKPAYAHLAHRLGLDAIISKKRAVANAILRYVSRGQVESTLMLGEHDAEVIDFRVAEHPSRADLTVKPLRELGFPDGSLVGAIVRNGSAFIAKGDSVLQPLDELLVVCTPEVIARVEKLLA
jgi:trk system potassium uptake protein